MGQRPLYIFYSFSAWADFRRQILTSKVCPRTERVKAEPAAVSSIAGITAQQADQLSLLCKLDMNNLIPGI